MLVIVKKSARQIKVTGNRVAVIGLGRQGPSGVPGALPQLSDVSDATVATTAGHVLRANGSAWVNSSIQAADLPTGLDAAKIADGTVSNVEFQALNGVTSPLQAQIDQIRSDGAIQYALEKISWRQDSAGWEAFYGGAYTSNSTISVPVKLAGVDEGNCWRFPVSGADSEYFVYEASGWSIPVEQYPLGWALWIDYSVRSSIPVSDFYQYGAAIAVGLALFDASGNRLPVTSIDCPQIWGSHASYNPNAANELIAGSVMPTSMVANIWYRARTASTTGTVFGSGLRPAYGVLCAWIGLAESSAAFNLDLVVHSVGWGPYKTSRGTTSPVSIPNNAWTSLGSLRGKTYQSNLNYQFIHPGRYLCNVLATWPGTYTGGGRAIRAKLDGVIVAESALESPVSGSGNPFTQRLSFEVNRTNSLAAANSNVANGYASNSDSSNLYMGSSSNLVLEAYQSSGVSRTITATASVEAI